MQVFDFEKVTENHPENEEKIMMLKHKIVENIQWSTFSIKKISIEPDEHDVTGKQYKR